MGNPESPIIPQNPVEAVLPFAERLTFSREFDAFVHGRTETDMVFEMNLCLRGLEMLGEYELEASKAFVIPEDTTPDAEGNVHGTELDLETVMNGDLVGGRTLKIGELASGRYVRAVCLTFEDVLIKYRKSLNHGFVSYFTKIEETERMYVPVFAINEIKAVH